MCSGIRTGWMLRTSGASSSSSRLSIADITRTQELSEINQNISEVLCLSSFCLDLVVWYHTKIAELKQLASSPAANQDIKNFISNIETHHCDENSVFFREKCLSLFSQNLHPERASQDQLLPTMKLQLKNWRISFSQAFIDLEHQEVLARCSGS